MDILAAPSPSQPLSLQTPPATLDAGIDDADLFLGDDVSDEQPDDDDLDKDYFASTYRPLSNLPTPPPSSQSSLVQSPSDHDDALESSLLGPAVHLVNMLPSACSLVTPSVALVQAMLTRAQLPINTLALAVCILDSLDSRFARTWRLTCPLATPQTSAPSHTPSPSLSTLSPLAHAGKRHTLPSPLPFSLAAAPSADQRLLHIDAVFPEVIILAALVIAAKFDDDRHATQQPAQAYCTAWSSGASLWTGAQLAATERCIMQSLNYRIMPLLDDELLADACADMRRAGVQALRAQKARAAQKMAKALAQAPTPPEQDVVVQRPPSAADADAMHRTHLTTLMKRRHHVPSHSECLGRFTYDP